MDSSFLRTENNFKYSYDALRIVFVRFGFHKYIVHDNGMPFLSEEFIHFLHQNAKQAHDFHPVICIMCYTDSKKALNMISGYNN